LSGAAAAGIALINTAGYFAGFAAGYITGVLKGWTGSYVVPMFLVGTNWTQSLNMKFRSLGTPRVRIWLEPIDTRSVSPALSLTA